MCVWKRKEVGEEERGKEREEETFGAHKSLGNSDLGFCDGELGCWFLRVMFEGVWVGREGGGGGRGAYELIA